MPNFVKKLSPSSRRITSKTLESDPTRAILMTTDRCTVHIDYCPIETLAVMIVMIIARFVRFEQQAGSARGTLWMRECGEV